MTFEELFLGKEVEVVLEEYSATNPPPGVTVPNEGLLVSFDSNGIVLQRRRDPSQVAFFPYATIRCIRRKHRTQAAGQVRGGIDENTIVTNASEPLPSAQAPLPRGVKKLG